MHGSRGEIPATRFYSSLEYNSAKFFNFFHPIPLLNLNDLGIFEGVKETTTKDLKMKKFEIGKTYYCRSVCNYDCVWTFKVTARTASTITIKAENGETSKKRVSVYQDCEECKPLGSYSMCPILTAEKVA